MRKLLLKSIHSAHEAGKLGDITTPKTYNRIAVAVDFGENDSEIIRHAVSMANEGSKILIIHVVESAAALVMGHETGDYETISDKKLLDKYQSYMESKGFNTEAYLGFGNPKKVIPRQVNEFDADLLVMGAHGHNFIKDIIFGTTVRKVRHRVKIPLFIVKV